MQKTVGVDRSERGTLKSHWPPFAHGFIYGYLIGAVRKKENDATPIAPNGEKRSADTLANALHVAKLLTGEAEEEYVDTARKANGRKGGAARTAALIPEQRREIARKGAAGRKGVYLANEKG